MSNLKLGVEVVSALNLMPKDGQGSSSPFVEAHFDGQKFRTTIKEKDLNPVWNEKFVFTVTDPVSLPHKYIEIYIYNDVKPSHTKSFLGYVRLSCTTLVPDSEALVQHYQLEKRWVLSRVKGEVALKVYLIDPFMSQMHDPQKLSDPLFDLLQQNDPLHLNEPLHINPNVNTTATTTNTRQFYHLNRNEYHSEPTKGEVQSDLRPPPLVVRPQQSAYQGPMSSTSGDYALKETSPFLGGGRVVGGRVVQVGSSGGKPTSTYDLVESMQYLFVRVVKARDLPSADMTGGCDPFVEVKVGNYKGITTHFEKKQNPYWNEVFAFSRERLQASVVEVVVKDKDLVKDDIMGCVRFDLNEVPTRVPPDSPLAPEWYRLEDKKGEKIKGELMLAVWLGTQADEAFSEAWHSDAATLKTDNVNSIRSKVYVAPRLWYVRVNVIEAQDLHIPDKTRLPDAFVKVQLGSQFLKTKPVQSRTLSPVWNEDLLFVAAEPFEEPLIFTVEDRAGPNKDEVLCRADLSLTSVERRADDRLIHSRWLYLEKPKDAILIDGDAVKEAIKKEKFSSRLHVRVCLDGGYHVLDESTHYSSDLRATAKQLWKPSIGVLELGILSAQGLNPMKSRETRGTCDAFCVAKYGQKWVRTRTIVDSLAPKWNEQYTWEVYDPCTVLTIGMFDNGQLAHGSEKAGEKAGEKAASLGKDLKIGKVRVRLSTLETGRVYTHSYPLLVLHPSGVKKMGELHLAIRFSCTSMLNMMYLYSKPLLPKMHYIRPLSVIQLDSLRYQATAIVAARLSRSEPPLRKEVIEYMSDVDSHLWSMRRSKANFFRLMSVFSGLLATGKWLGNICAWRNPITTVLFHVLFLILVCFPDLILPTAFLYMFLIGLWNFRYRPRYPPHMDTRLSYAEAVHPDELDEEFDSFPTSRHADIVRMRYDRLRSVAGRIQAVVGDVATQGERLQGLLSWRDSRATAIFVAFCFISAVVLYVTPLQAVVVFYGFYHMRHPRFRHRLPSAPLNFFRRLPARTDSLL
ncbi:hypothetical protein AMTRI_Chr07g30640 [Amborella trichopoda]